MRLECQVEARACRALSTGQSHVHRRGNHCACISFPLNLEGNIKSQAVLQSQLKSYKLIFHFTAIGYVQIRHSLLPINCLI